MIYVIIIILLMALVSGVEEWIATVPWLLILSVGLHIFEERACGFRKFFNVQILHSRSEWKPVTEGEEKYKDQIGLFLSLTFLLASGSPWMWWAAIGFIAADTAQHFIFSVTRGYTPGVATALILYLPQVVMALREPRFDIIPAALAMGAAGLIGNYLLAKVRAKINTQ